MRSTPTPQAGGLLGYTFSKSFDRPSSLSGAVGPLNLRLSKALPAFDLRFTFVASYNWKLPFERLLRVRNRWAGGWSPSGITRFSTGLPVTLFNNNDTSLAGMTPNGINSIGVDRPDYAPGNLNVNTDPRNGRSDSPRNRGTGSRPCSPRSDELLLSPVTLTRTFLSS